MMWEVCLQGAAGRLWLWAVCGRSQTLSLSGAAVGGMRGLFGVR
jgi:hypothetical protein